MPERCARCGMALSRWHQRLSADGTKWEALDVDCLLWEQDLRTAIAVIERLWRLDDDDAPIPVLNRLRAEAGRRAL